MTTVLSPVSVNDVRELVRPLEPVASVYLGPTTDPTSDGQLELSLRRRRIGQELSSQGANDATVDTVTGFLTNLPEYAHEYALFADGGRVLLAHQLPGAVDADWAAYAAPARVAPMLAWLQRHPAYVRVVVDRAGADLLTVPAGTLAGSTRTVAGPDDEIRHRFPGVGHSPRMQRRAQDSWVHNARAVTEAVAEEVDRVHAELLLVAGEQRTVQLLTEQLRHTTRVPALRLPPGGRRGPASDRDASTGQAVRDFAQQQTAALLADVADGIRPNGPAVQGADQTLSALAARLVRVLLIVDDPTDKRIGWCGPDLLCAAERPDLSLPDPRIQPGHLADIAIRAALLTRAQVRVLSPTEGTGLPDGIAALLRFS